VIAKVERHPGELYPRAGFIVTSRPTSLMATLIKRTGIADELPLISHNLLDNYKMYKNNVRADKRRPSRQFRI